MKPYQPINVYPVLYSIMLVCVCDVYLEFQFILILYNLERKIKIKMRRKQTVKVIFVRNSLC